MRYTLRMKSADWDPSIDGSIDSSLSEDDFDHQRRMVEIHNQNEQCRAQRILASFVRQYIEKVRKLKKDSSVEETESSTDSIGSNESAADLNQPVYSKYSPCPFGGHS